MTYSLRDYFIEAKASMSSIPDCFSSIFLRHPTVDQFKPLWHQVTGLNLILVNSRSALFDQQGCGKTLPAQAAMIWNAVMGNRPIALMPPILIDQFIQAFYDTFEGATGYTDIVAYRGTKKERNTLLLEWQNKETLPIIVMTPEIFRKEFTAFKALNCLALFCDECKYWANTSTKISRAINLFLGNYGDKILVGMNGTPAKNNLADLYGYIRLLTPWVYKNKMEFYNAHVVEKEVPIRYNKNGASVTRDIKIIDSFKNIGKLKENLYLQARRVEKKDVLELPPKHIINFNFHLNKKHKLAYDEFCFARFMEFDDGSAISGEQTATLRQIAAQSIANPSLFNIDEESSLLEAVGELLDEINTNDNKVCIAAHYNKTIEVIAEKFKELNPAIVYGPTSSNNSKQIEKFKTDDSCRILIANYQSGGVGLNLQDVCHYAIAAEPTTVPGDFEQWTDRIHRTGQKENTTIYALIATDTIWVKMVASMLNKYKWNAAVVNLNVLKDELAGR